MCCFLCRCEGEQLDVQLAGPALQSQGRQDLLRRLHSLYRSPHHHVRCALQSILFSRSVRLKRSPYSITDRRVPELVPVLGSQPAGDVSHKPDGRLSLLSARPAVTPATLKRAATSFAAW